MSTTLVLNNLRNSLSIGINYSVRRLASPISSSIANRYLPTVQCAQFQQNRFLFSDEVLGVDRFVQLRQQIGQRFGNQKGVFLERLTEHINDDKNSILSEDLKNLILLCEKEHIELLKKAIDKFEKQNETLRFGLFQFGPVVMRLAKHLNNPQMAMWIFQPTYKQFFNQISSVTIAMDILFENQQYADVLKLFEYATTKLEFDVKYPVDFVVLYFAAAYKLNTIESFESAFRLLRSVQKSDAQIKLRGMNFFLALAVNQNHPNIALEIIQQLNYKSMNTVMQSIRLLANAKINRFHDVIEILKYYLKKDKALIRTKVVFQDTLDQIVVLVKNSNKDEYIQQIETLVKNLQESNMIQSDHTLDQSLMQTMNFVRRKHQQQKEQFDQKKERMQQ